MVFLISLNPVEIAENLDFFSQKVARRGLIRCSLDAGVQTTRIEASAKAWPPQMGQSPYMLVS
jgi:hypothetical protein